MKKTNEADVILRLYPAADGAGRMNQIDMRNKVARYDQAGEHTKASLWLEKLKATSKNQATAPSP